MMSSKKYIENIYSSLFFLGLILLPFNQISGVILLREYSQETAIYCWLLGGLLVFLNDIVVKKRIDFPYKSRIVFFWSLFFTWCLLSYAFNFTEIQNNYFKFRSGNNRFFSQLISLLLTSYFLIYFFNAVFQTIQIEKLFFRIRKLLLYVFVFVFVYGIIEFIGDRFGSIGAKSVIEVLNYLPVLDKTIYYGGRLSSVSFEVPALGNYLIFIFAWMFSYVFTEKIWYRRFVPSVLVLVLTILSGARAALMIVLVQACLSVLLYLKVYQIKINYKWGLSFLGLLVAITLVNFEKINVVFTQKYNFFDVEHSISNRTRYGMQYASLEVFKNKPITGVGLGQNGFHKKDYYPEWALKDNYEFTKWYLNEKVYSFAPDFNLYIRLLAETGIIGLTLFGLFCFVLVREAWLLVNIKRLNTQIIGTVLVISFIGFLINWMQIDYFRQFGFWLCLVLLIKFRKENEFRKE